MAPSPLASRLPRRSAAAIARRVLGDVAGGALLALPVSIRFWDGSVLRATAHDGDGPAPEVHLRRRAIAHVLHEPGELGLSRGYVDGSITTADDLERLLSLRGRMQAIALTGADRARLLLAAVLAAGPSVLRRPPVPAIEAVPSHERRHSVDRDRDSVRHHYDVSNDFYRLVLGDTMVYSCAYFTDPADPLHEAQERKLDVICRKLDLHEGERLLDIGCGWGSLVIHAARHYGVRATGVTLSEPQAALARERAEQAGVGDRVEILVSDYRELGDRRFDKIASVGMYEHVGRSELGGYVRTARDLLDDGGLMLNHGITRLGADRPNPKSFIARYIFPDGELHPIGDLLQELQDNDMEVRDVESLREHYPLTLRDWIANLRAHRDEALAMVGEQRTRTWDLYMLGSAMAFEAGEISIYQTLAARGGAPHGLPLDRLALLTPRHEAAAVD